ncbi:MAG: MFS transporter [Anaerolineae bacterium]|nr:MFS transporter [Anaerolineae bacterium]
MTQLVRGENAPHTRSTVLVFLINNALMTLGFGLWQAIFNNFAVEELGVRADQIGLIQSIREVPGLIGFVVGLLALVLVEVRIAGLAAMLMGLGIYLTAYTHDVFWLVAATLLMSTGFHFFYSSNSSALLLTVDRKDGPQALGLLNSVGAMATVASTVLIFATLDAWGYRTLFRVAGLMVIVGNVILWPFARQSRHGQQRRQRTPIRRTYWLYYALQFLNGSRRHIVTTFALFLLVREYNVSAQIVTLLFLINSLIGTYLHRAFGRIVARFGERRVLLANYAIVLVIFVAYAVIPSARALNVRAFLVPAFSIGPWTIFPAFSATIGLIALLVVFIVDRTLIGFSIAVESYMQKIALSPQEITGNVALGQTINHIAAVIVPIAGGVVWESMGSRFTFLAGMAIVLVAFVLATRMRIETQSAPQPILAGAPLVAAPTPAEGTAAPPGARDPP